MIIGITGYARHGKDTTGNYLVKNYGFTRYAFADQLKSMALVLNPFVDREYKLRLYTVVQDRGWDEAKKNPEVRRFLQVLGTEAVRDHLGEDAWVDALHKKITDDGTFNSNIVITDVRFPNEARWLKNNGGKLWRVKRVERLIQKGDGITVTLDFDNGLGTDHPSEKFVSVLKSDTTLIAASVEDLYLEIDELMRRSR